MLIYLLARLGKYSKIATSLEYLFSGQSQKSPLIKPENEKFSTNVKKIKKILINF